MSMCWTKNGNKQAGIAHQTIVVDLNVQHARLEGREGGGLALNQDDKVVQKWQQAVTRSSQTCC